MASTHLATVAFQGPSGLASDRYVNGFHFYGEGIDFDNLRDLLGDFYSVVNPFGQAISTSMPNTLGVNPAMRVYDLSEPKPRVPKYESTLPTLTYGSGDPLPFEVALCFSFEAEKESGVSQRRRRNRVYLGPFRESANDVNGRPNEQLLEDIVYAGCQMKLAADASVNWQWVVYSPTDNDRAEIDHIWCDNAWDTQRRRGNDPQLREQWFVGDPPYPGS